jgi:hypothetical protein
MNLSRYFGPEWAGLDQEVYNGLQYYPAFQVRRIIRLRNRKVRSIVSPENWRLENVRELNPFRTIYMINLQGVLELIMFTNTPETIRIKNHLITNVVLPHRNNICYR